MHFLVDGGSWSLVVSIVSVGFWEVVVVVVLTVRVGWLGLFGLSVNLGAVSCFKMLALRVFVTSQVLQLVTTGLGCGPFIDVPFTALMVLLSFAAEG